MNESYIKPELIVSIFDVEDVITTSGTTSKTDEDPVGSGGDTFGF